MYPELADIGIRDFRCQSINEYRYYDSPHHHDHCFEIGFIKKGITSHKVFSLPNHQNQDPQVITLHGGDLCVFLPYQIRSTEKNYPQDGIMYWIVIDPECPNLLNESSSHIRQLRESLQSLRQQVFHIPNHISSNLISAFELSLNMNEDRLFKICCLLSLFILEVSDYYKAYVDNKSIINRISKRGMEAISFIDDNIANPDLNLNLLANHLHYSRTYTSTFFKEEIGTIFQEFVTRRKIIYACERLMNHSVLNTSAILNFSSSQYFSNTYKKYMSVTPTEYMKMKNKSKARLTILSAPEKR